MKTPRRRHYTQSELLKLYIGELKGLKAIGKEIHSDPRTFKDRITSLGIEVPFPGSIWCKVSQHFNGQFFKPLPQWLEEVIIGSLLGDAQIRLQSKVRAHYNNPSILKYEAILVNISKLRKRVSEGKQITKVEIQYWNSAINLIKQTNTANFRLHKSILEKEWVKLLVNTFEQFVNVKTFVKPTKTQTVMWTCGFDTSSTIQLFDLWNRWYNQEKKRTKKVLPNLPKLSPNILLHWFIDDGCMSGTDFSLATQAFSLKEQKKLVDYLKTIGLETKIRITKRQPHINISNKKENKNVFTDFISRAKFYKQAKEQFPYKFSNSILKREWKKKIFEKHPEYCDNSNQARDILYSSIIE